MLQHSATSTNYVRLLTLLIAIVSWLWVNHAWRQQQHDADVRWCDASNHSCPCRTGLAVNVWQHSGSCLLTVVFFFRGGCFCSPDDTQSTEAFCCSLPCIVSVHLKWISLQFNCAPFTKLPLFPWCGIDLSTRSIVCASLTSAINIASGSV